MFRELHASDFDSRPAPTSSGAKGNAGRRLCSSGKRCFTKNEARHRAGIEGKARGVTLYRYRCALDDCAWWHLTSSPHRGRKGDPAHMGGKRSRR